MKDKNRVTLIFCTVEDGEKVPLSVIGNIKNLYFFRPLIEIQK